MIGSFSFNGVESSSFNLVCKSVTRPLLPAVKTRRIEIPGMSGLYDLDINGVDYEYEMRTVTMLIQYIGSSYIELRTRARQISAWLSTQGFKRLIINDENDKYYSAKVTSEINLESLWESGSAEISFDCQPFAYSVTEQILTYNGIAALDVDFTNPGTRTITYKSPPGSRFHIQITGSWTTLAVGINGAVIQYPIAGSGVLTIDNIDMEVYLDGVNKFSVITGNYDTFLKVIPGENNLIISGAGINANVIVRYIPLWL
jgi:predicted phage tail component-like protein